MADSCAIAAVRAGARELKAAAYRLDAVSLPNVAKVLNAKGDAFGVSCSVRTTQMKRITDQIAWMFETGRSKRSPFDNGVQDDDGSLFLTAHDDVGAVMKAAQKLGYDLSEEDGAKVYEAFKAIAQKKEKVSARELDAIVASAAMQVPPTYQLDTYVITKTLWMLILTDISRNVAEMRRCLWGSLLCVSTLGMMLKTAKIFLNSNIP